MRRALEWVPHEIKIQLAFTLAWPYLQSNFSTIRQRLCVPKGLTSNHLLERLVLYHETGPLYLNAPLRFLVQSEYSEP